MEKTAFTPVPITPKNGLAFRPYVVANQLEKLLHKNYCGIGLLQNGMACAALVGRHSGQSFEVTSLCVDEAVRRQGAASLLLRAVQGLMKKLDCNRLLLQYAHPAQRDIETFLLRRGFMAAGESGKQFRIPLTELRSSKLLQGPPPALCGEFLTLEQLGQDRADLFRRELRGQGVTADWNVQGGLVQARATWFYAPQGRPVGFCGCSLLEDGSLYLTSFYADKRHAQALQPLLVKTLQAIAANYPEHQSFLVASASPEEEKVIRYLFREQEESVQIETLRWAVWQPATEEKETDTMNFEEMNPNFAILQPKLGSLGDVLREVGMENDLVLSATQLPYLLAETDVDGQKTALTFHYIATDPDANGHFVLNLAAQLPCEAIDLASRFFVCSRFNLNTTGPMACPSLLDDSIRLRSLFPEAEYTVDLETLRFFVRLFQEGLAQLLAMLKESPEFPPTAESQP